VLGHIQVKAPLQLTIIMKRKHIYYIGGYLDVLHIRVFNEISLLTVNSAEFRTGSLERSDGHPNVPRMMNLKKDRRGLCAMADITETSQLFKNSVIRFVITFST
jgi:hypothetical protein